MLEAVMGLLAAFDLSAVGDLLEAGRMSGGSGVGGVLEAGYRGP
jgi:hypothetical protein